MDVVHNRKPYYFQDNFKVDHKWKKAWESKIQDGDVYRHLGSERRKMAERKASDRCYKIFQPILWLLFLLGIDLFRNRNLSSVVPAIDDGGVKISMKSSDVADTVGERCVRALFKGLSRLVCLALLAGCISWHLWDLIVRKPGFSDLGMCTQVTVLITLINTLFVYLLFVIKGNSVAELLHEVIDFCGIVVDNMDKWYRRTRIGVTVMVLLTEAAVLSLTVYVTYTYGHLDEEIPFPINNTSNQILAQNYRFIELGVEIAAVFALNIHVCLVVYYLVFSVVFIKSFSSTADALDFGLQKRPGLAPGTPGGVGIAGAVGDVISTFIRHHQRLCKSVEKADEAFCQMVACWTLTELTCVIFSIRGMDLARDGARSYSFQTDTIIIVFMLCVVFILKSLCAASINDQVVSSLTKITALDENAFKKFTGQDFLQYSADELKCQLYVQYVNVDAPGLTGWGLFVISRGFILAAAGNVLTYVLVLYNINSS